MWGSISKAPISATFVHVQCMLECTIFFVSILRCVYVEESLFPAALLEQRKSYAHQKGTTGSRSVSLQLCPFSKWKLLLKERICYANKKRDYWIKQCFSSFVSLSEMGTSIKGKNLLPEGANSFL